MAFPNLELNKGVAEDRSRFFRGVQERLLNVTTFSKQFCAAAGAVTLSCRRVARTNPCRTAQASAGMVYECTALNRGEEK